MEPKEKKLFSEWDESLAAETVKEFEGLRLNAYQCSAGVWTIGWGHTGSEVAGMLTITRKRAEQFLAADLTRTRDYLARFISAPVTKGQFIAIVSLAFNCGGYAIARSTLVRMLNAGDARGAAEQFAQWINVRGQPNPGLINRRAREAEIFVS